MADKVEMREILWQDPEGIEPDQTFKVGLRRMKVKVLKRLHKERQDAIDAGEEVPPDPILDSVDGESPDELDNWDLIKVNAAVEDFFEAMTKNHGATVLTRRRCLLYTSPSPRD